MRDGTAAMPIEDHGVIGDLRTAALVGMDGCIDFLCAPEFDSPSVFARLLDPAAGHFRVAPAADGLRITQRYLPDTNVLITRFMSDNGIAELIDYMTLPAVRGGEAPQCLARKVSVIRGEFAFVIECAPRFDYARSGHTVELQDGVGVFRPDGVGPTLVLSASLPLTISGDDLVGRFTVRAGEEARVVLTINPDEPRALDVLAADEAYCATVARWQDWIGQSLYKGRWREIVNRSALVLKLMTSIQHGAMVAAPTFGLPETAGGAKNWDYRYCWIRDASFAMYAFVRLGLFHEMEGFMGWIGYRVSECAESGSEDPLRIMYRLDGGTELEESELDGMSGWDGSRPVRIGNAAAGQFQLDIYGELMDAVYLANKYGQASSYAGWRDVCRIVEWVRSNWRRPDRGIWESRGEDREYLYSRLMCWVALDRAIRLAQKRSLPAPLPEWNQTRLDIHASIHHEFWNEEMQSFVAHAGAETMDGAMLLMPLLRFVSPRDPRWLSTLARIGEQLVVDALVFRRPPNDGASREGSFLACSFWYVEALARSGDLPQAQLLFDKLLGYANHVGLYAEELSFSGRHLGNFPQVLTHLALISAASYLDRAQSRDTMGTWS